MPEAFKLELDPSQLHMAKHMIERRRTWNQSKPGTGKTLSCIHGYAMAKQDGSIKGKALVFAPKTILQPSWGDDIEKYNLAMGTNLTYTIAYAGKKRLENLMADVDFVITNHDAVKFMSEHYVTLRDAGYEWLIMDEATAYKNMQSQRTKAMLMVRTLCDMRTAMSGNPNAKTNLDLFAPTFIVDDGDHLGKSFYKFRSQIADCERVGPDPNHVRWTDRPGATEEVSQALADMTVCYDLELSAKNEVVTYKVDLPKRVLAAYEQMRDMQVVETENGDFVSAVNAGVKLNKMLQILTGNIYDSEGNAHIIHTDRAELVMEQVLMREHSLVAFNWNHELDQLEKLAKKNKLRYGIIKGGVPDHIRTQVMRDFQDGHLDVVFAHPKSAAHGLTFTRGTAVIWCSPCNSPEYFQQFNARVHRKGQTKDNQIIRIAAKGTKEEEVYNILDDANIRTEDMLGIMTGVTMKEGERYAASI